MGGAGSQIKCTLIKGFIEEGERSSVGGYWLAQSGPLNLSGPCHMVSQKPTIFSGSPPNSTQIPFEC